jgi:hypothetical protein
MKLTLKNRHDYLTLQIIESKEKRLNLTISRNGENASGKGMQLADLERLSILSAGK